MAEFYIAIAGRW